VPFAISEDLPRAAMMKPRGSGCSGRSICRNNRGDGSCGSRLPKACTPIRSQCGEEVAGLRVVVVVSGADEAASKWSQDFGCASGVTAEHPAR
jgi:hypothetical protein